MNDQVFQFDAEVDVYDFGRMAYSVLFLPADMVSQLPLEENPRLRIDGFVADQPFHGAFQPAGGGAYYLILSKKFLKSANLAVGDTTTAWFRIADQDAVDVPLELEQALSANHAASSVWDKLTAGKRRGYAHRVSSAKRASTRAARVKEVLEELSHNAG